MKTPTQSFAAALMLLASVCTGVPVAADTVSTPPAQSPPTKLPDLTREEAARLIGVGFGEQLLRLDITDPAALESLSRGMQEGLKGRKTTADEQQRLAHFFYASTKAAIASNLNNAHAFLVRNADEKNVLTTASGLQYTILAPGDSTAASPTLADQVTVRYRGTLLDGTEFDSSEARGAPATFLVGGVIKGWQEALVMMKPGAKWRLFVPPELGYGKKARRNIPGGSLLIFEVELNSVSPAAVPASPTVAPAGTP